AVRVLAVLDLVDDDAALETAVGDDLAQGLLDRAADDLHAEGLLIADLEAVERLQGADEGHAAAGDDALLDGRAGRVERILHAGLLLLHLGLGGRTDVDHRDAADQLREALLELLAVVVGRGLLDLRTDLAHAGLDVVLLARAIDDGGVVLVDGDALGLAQVLDGHALELETQVLGEQLAAGEGRDVLEHGLAAIAEAGGLHRRHVEHAADLVDHQRGQRLTLDLLGDDEQRLAGAGHLLEHRQEVLHVADLLLVDQDQGVVEDDLHALRIGHEVGREVAAVELHALDHAQGGLQALGLLDRDHALLADLLHRVGDGLADGGVAVRGDGADLGDVLLALGGLGQGLELGGDGGDRLVDAALDVHRVVTRGHQLAALAED